MLSREGLPLLGAGRTSDFSRHCSGRKGVFLLTKTKEGSHADGGGVLLAWWDQLFLPPLVFPDLSLIYLYDKGETLK